tara:strand:+ start:635 stop:919 length:285 start_codon:yes stop_codon:yes gene_type:complete
MLTVAEFEKGLRLGYVFSHPSFEGTIQGEPIKKPFGKVVASSCYLLHKMGNVDVSFVAGKVPEKGLHFSTCSLNELKYSMVLDPDFVSQFKLVN